jgi:nuclear transport factor 2 (NTF2) superfamily protein
MMTRLTGSAANGNENWEFNAEGLMQHRFASINDLPIAEHERKFRWPLGGALMTIRGSAKIKRGM